MRDAGDFGGKGYLGKEGRGTGEEGLVGGRRKEGRRGGIGREEGR